MYIGYKIYNVAHGFQLKLYEVDMYNIITADSSISSSTILLFRSCGWECVLCIKRRLCQTFRESNKLHV